MAAETKMLRHIQRKFCSL